MINLYQVIKTMYLIEELANESKNGIFPFSQCYYNSKMTNEEIDFILHKPIYYDKDNRFIVADKCVDEFCHHDIISYMTEIGDNDITYDIFIKLYQDEQDDDDWISNHKGIENVAYLHLCARHSYNEEDDLYIYNGNIYTDEIDVWNAIENEWIAKNSVY